MVATARMNKRMTTAEVVAQLRDGMTLGIGAALSENLVADTRSGAFINHDLAEYLIAVHADIAAIDAIMLDAVEIGRAHV